MQDFVLDNRGGLNLDAPDSLLHPSIFLVFVKTSFQPELLCSHEEQLDTSVLNLSIPIGATDLRPATDYIPHVLRLYEGSVKAHYMCTSGNPVCVKSEGERHLSEKHGVKSSRSGTMMFICSRIKKDERRG